MLRLSEEERRHYEAFQKHLHDIASEKLTQKIDFEYRLKEEKEKSREEGKEEGIVQIAVNTLKQGIGEPLIMQMTGLTTKQLKDVKAKHNL